MYAKIASIMLIASVLGLGALAPLMRTQTSIAQQEDLIQAIAGGFESISVVQDSSQIVITITKLGGEAPPADNGTVPTDPIIILPPNNETGQNGTVIVPEPLPPVTNETQPPAGNETGGNATLPVEPPVIIIEPPGNVTQVEPPSNVTVIDNGTVIIHPPEQNVTETPGNVTVVDPPVQPPVGNETGVPGECGCPIEGGGGPTLPIDETGSQPVQPPADVNQNITIEQPPVPTQLPVFPEEGGDGGGDGNGNGDGNNGGG
jgi:hypothetical protein